MHATLLSSNTNCHLSTLYPLCISIIPIITHYTHQTIPPSPFHARQPMSSFIHCTLSLYTTPSSYPLLGALPIHSLHLSTAMHGHALVMLFSTHLGSHASFITSTSLHPYLTPHACHLNLHNTHKHFATFSLSTPQPFTLMVFSLIYTTLCHPCMYVPFKTPPYLSCHASSIHETHYPPSFHMPTAQLTSSFHTRVH